MRKLSKASIALIASVILSVTPVAFGATNTTAMTDEMMNLLITIMPIMLIVMIFKMLASSFGGQ